MNKRTIRIFAVAAILSLGSGAWAQIQTQPLVDDFATLVSGNGRSTLPQLQQIALSGDIVGQAELHGFTFSLIGTGATFGPGPFSVLKSDPNTWKFVLSIPSLLNDVVPSSGMGHTVYEATQNTFSYPSIKLGLGFPIAAGFEFLVNGFYMPQALTDLASNSIKGMTPSFSILNVNGKIRKVLLRDSGPYPAISFGLGGGYSAVDIGAKITDIKELNNGNLIDLGGGIGTMDMTGTVAVKTEVKSFGFDLNLSKRLAAIFIPFLRLSEYYQSSTYDGNVNLNATIYPTATPLSPTHQVIQTHPKYTANDFQTFLTGGLEIALGPLVLNSTVSANLGQLNAADGKTDGISASAGLRLQF
jgi:hypothetical protein